MGHLAAMVSRRRPCNVLFIAEGPETVNLVLSGGEVWVGGGRNSSMRVVKEEYSWPEHFNNCFYISNIFTNMFLRNQFHPPFQVLASLHNDGPSTLFFLPYNF